MGVTWVAKYIKTMGSNFGKVTPHLFRGSLPSAGDLKDLKEKGVTTVVSLLDDREKMLQVSVAAAALDLEHHLIRMSDHEAPTTEQVREFLRLVDVTAGTMYVHCNGGRHRTGLMVAIYRVVEGGWSKADAWHEAEKYGFYSENGHGDLRRFFWEEFEAADYQATEAADDANREG